MKINNLDEIETITNDFIQKIKLIGNNYEDDNYNFNLFYLQEEKQDYDILNKILVDNIENEMIIVN